MIPLNSRCLRGAQYFPDTRQMLLWFHGYGPYPFYNVPPAVFTGLINAIGWHGEYYHQFIRGRFRA
jgi:hypothetical protein